MKEEEIRCACCERTVKGFECRCGWTRWRPTDDTPNDMSFGMNGKAKATSREFLVIRETRMVKTKGWPGDYWRQVPEGALAVLDTRSR